MKIISAQEHQTVETPAVLTLANDVDPRTLDLSGVTRIDLQFLSLIHISEPTRH